MSEKPKSELQLLASIEGANGVPLLQSLKEARAQAVQAARVTGKKAKIVLTLEFEPTKFNKGRALAIKGDVKATIPRKPGDPTHLFDDEAGNLYDDDVQAFNGDRAKTADSIAPRLVPEAGAAR